MSNELERLYKRLRQLDPEDLYKIEADFFLYFYKDKRKAALPPVKTFLIVSGWYGTWFRSGSWVFYESTPKSDIEDTVKLIYNDESHGGKYYEEFEIDL